MRETNAIGVGRGQRNNREFCVKEQKKIRHARHARTSPGQATLTSHRSGKPRTKQTTVSWIKRKCWECPLAARTSRAPTDTQKKGNMHGSARETCRPQKGGGPVTKSDYKSTLTILVDETDRRRTVCVRPTQLGWAAARESIKRFAEENKKKDRHARTSPGQRPPRPHTRSGKPSKKQTTVSRIKRKCWECPLGARTSRAPTDTREKATCTAVLERLAAPKKVAGR